MAPPKKLAPACGDVTEVTARSRFETEASTDKQDTEFREWHETSHSAVTTCLHPTISTAELYCKNVGSHRTEMTASIFQHVAARLEGLGGLVDESALRIVLDDLFDTEEELQVEKPSDAEMDLLLSFIPFDNSSDPMVLHSKVTLAATLWYLSQLNLKEWGACLKLPLRRSPLMKALVHINQGELVQISEARWVQEKFTSIASPESIANTKLLLCVACWYSTLPKQPGSLDRELLLERMQVEIDLYRGCRLFILWAAVFIFFGNAMTKSVASERNREIKDHLEMQLKLEDAEAVTSPNEIYGLAKAFSERTDHFAPASNNFFSENHAWLIQDPPRTFSSPVLLPYLMVPDPNPSNVMPASLLVGESFTMQAWVQVAQHTLFGAGTGLSLLTKTLANDENLKCWSWRFPLQLSFGAHDYGSRNPNDVTGTYEEYVNVSYDMARELRGEVVLHTLIVNGSTATFMVNEDVYGSVELPRAVTDCQSKDIKLGDAGLTLASVKFYPRPLDTIEISQIFHTGLTWQEIGLSAAPQKMREEPQSMNNWQNEWRTDRPTASQAAALASTIVNQLVGTDEAPPPPYVNENEDIVEAFDPVLGKFWSIHDEPVYTSSESKIRARGILIPQHEGASGLTVSGWVKLASVGYFMSLAMPLFSEEDAKNGDASRPIWDGFGNQCWAMFIEEEIPMIMAASASGPPRTAEEEHHFFQGLGTQRTQMDWRVKAYQHYAFSIDPRNLSHPFRICINGKCSDDASFQGMARWTVEGTKAARLGEKNRPAASCMQTALAQSYSASFREKVLNQTRLYIGSRPLEYEWPLRGWQAQTKFFDRVLSETELRHIFETDRRPGSKLPFREELGCKREPNDDHAWRDTFGRGCVWYHQARGKTAVACVGEVLHKCPRACGVLELCWGQEPPATLSFNIWNRQMFFEPKGPHGTMCLAKSTSPAQEAAACAAKNNTEICRKHNRTEDCTPWNCSSLVANGTVSDEGKKAFLACLGGTFAFFREQPAFPCRAIFEASDERCAWDDAGLQKLQGSANATKSWSISMWYESLGKAGCLAPNIRFLGPGGAPFARVGVEAEGFKDTWDNRTQRWRGACAKEPYLHFLLQKGQPAEVKQPASGPGVKHLLVMGKPAGREKLRIVLDESDNEDEVGSMDPMDLKVVNVQGSLFLSPLELRDAMPTAASHSDMLYAKGRQHVQPRPLDSSFRKRTVSAYTQRTMLLQPPFLLLKRRGERTCAKEWIAKALHRQGTEMHCCHPYDCRDFSPKTVRKCATKKDATDKYYGQHPVTFRGRSYYMEFLKSMTSNSALAREEDNDMRAFKRTDQFVDVLTSHAQIMALFYTAEFDVLTILVINFDTSLGQVVAGTHFYHRTASQRNLKEIYGLLIVGSFWVLLLVCFAIVRLRDHRRAFLAERDNPGSVARRVSGDRRQSLQNRFGLPKETQSLELNRFARPGRCLPLWLHGTAWLIIGDIVLACATLVLCWWKILQNATFSAWMEEAVPDLLSEPHAGGMRHSSSEEAVDTMKTKTNFLDSMADVIKYLDVSGDMYTILFILIGVRALSATSNHPRIELITRTLELARSDLMHFFFLMATVFVGFALLGRWMFGSERDDFRSLPVALSTLADSVLSPPGNLPIKPEERYNFTDIGYIVLFHLICFFFLLNFVLAIVVDNYSMVVAEVTECTVEQSLPEDIYAVCRYKWLSWRYGWPDILDIMVHLSRVQLEAVTENDFPEELFPDQEARNIFFYTYSRLKFLHATGLDAVQPSQEKADALMMQKIDMLLDRVHLKGSRKSRL